VFRELDHATDAEACDAIVAGLPDWFGNEQGIRDCAAAVRSHLGLVALHEGEVAAFLTWAWPRAASVEVTWMAVRADLRRRSLGRDLMDAFLTRMAREGARLVLVKTLSDRAEDEPYRQTRAFYEAVGFVAATDLDIWSPENPCLLYVRPIEELTRPRRGTS
jgi:GNAT superfamily N-acetyltransferase